MLPHVAQQNRRSVNIIYRNIKKTLNLIRVQVHRQYAINARTGEHIGHYFCGDRYARITRATVLSGIPKIGDCGGDTGGRRAF